MLAKLRMCGLVSALALVLAACAPSVSFPTTGGEGTPGPETVQPGATAGAVPAVVSTAEQMVSRALGIPVSQVQMVSFDQMSWPDACLGLPRPGEKCAAVPTPGWRAILTANGKEYEVHLDNAGTIVRWTVSEATSTP